MSSAVKILPHYTYSDYCQWEGKWEIIDGFPHAMSPLPRPEHQAVAGNLHAEFRNAFKQNACACKVYQPLDYKITDDIILNPDLLILCNPISKNYLDFPPDLVVEILSPATILKDRYTKYDIYQRQRIKYYVIIDTDTKSVEIFQIDNDGQYRPQVFDQKEAFTFLLNSDCAVSILFNNIWN